MSAVRQESSPTGTVDGYRRVRPVQAWDETKSSLKTTELLVLLATVIGVIVVARTSDHLDTQWAMGFITALAIGYMLSRGIAKSGSSHRADGGDDA